MRPQGKKRLAYRLNGCNSKIYRMKERPYGRRGKRKRQERAAYTAAGKRGEYQRIPASMTAESLNAGIERPMWPQKRQRQEKKA